MIDVTQSAEDRLAAIEQALEALEVQPRDRHYVRRALELLRVVEAHDHGRRAALEVRIRLAVEAAEQVSQISTADVQSIHMEIDKVIAAWERLLVDWREEMSGKVLGLPLAMLGRAVRPGEMVAAPRGEVRTVRASVRAAP